MIHQEDVDFAKSKNMLWAEEEVMVTATERRVGPGGALITPTTIIATNKRILIINRATFGIRNDVESIPYNRVSSVRLEKGLISSSVFLRVGGYTSSGEQGFLKPGEQEGEIPGLKQQDAKDLSDFIEKMITGMTPNDIDLAPLPDTSPGQAAGEKGASTMGGGGYAYCPKCGAKNDISAKFCTACGAKLGK
ncbi:MAG: PH domain-containing protein [Candidatus Micrarchaeales archaeon]